MLKIRYFNNIESINIYSDSDVKYSFYERQFKSIKPIFDSKIKIFKNVCSKDYGNTNEKVVLERLYKDKEFKWKLI